MSCSLEHDQTSHREINENGQPKFETSRPRQDALQRLQKEPT